MEVRTGRNEQAVAFSELAIFRLARRILVAAVSLQRAEARVRQTPDEVTQRLALKFEGIRMSERHECTCRDRLFHCYLRCDFATFHIGMAATSDQTLEGVASICAMAGSNQRIGDVRAAKIAGRSGPHILPRDLEALLIEAPHHLFGTAFAVQLSRLRPSDERVRRGAREPGEQMTLAGVVLGGQFDTCNNMNTVLNTCGLSFGNPLQRVVIGQGQYFDPSLGSELDDEARCMSTIR